MSFCPFSEEDKHYFGSYLNLAHKNIFDVLNEFCSRFQLKNKKPKEKEFFKDFEDLKNFLINIFKENISISDYEKWIEVLSSYFPVVAYLDNQEKNRNKKEDRINNFRNNFLNLISTIDKLRNFYTHYFHNEVKIEDSVFEILDKLFENTLLEIKNKFLKTDKTQEALKKLLQKEIDTYTKNNKKEEVLKSIFEESIDIIDEKGNLKTECFSSKNISQPNNNGLKVSISLDGLVILLSIFLNKKDINHFRSNISVPDIIKGDEELFKKLNSTCIDRINSHLAYKGLKYRLKTSPILDKAVLMKQILDELNKVPDVIYKNIEESKQEDFIMDLNEYFRDNGEENQSLDNLRVVHPVIRKRYEDKFNYFALRFLDEYADFPKLRFQVHIGNYIHHQTDKFVGNSTKNRIIKEKINVFGKLNDIIKAKANYFHSSTIDTQWEEFPNPSYLFPKENIVDNKNQNANKIGIQLPINNPIINNILNEIPNLNQERNPNKKEKIYIVNDVLNINESDNNNANNNDNPIIPFGAPTAYLSMNDIHSILYEIIKNGTSGQKLENKIRRQIEKQIGDIHNQSEGIKILKKRIEIDNEQINYNKLKKDLESLINQTKNLQKEHQERIDSYNNKERKYILTNNEKGRIANWLANEIKQFMPQKFKSNWKGYQHNELQKLLAYYEISKDEVLKLLENSGTKEHFNFEKYSTLEELYEDYLNTKISTLSTLQQQLKNFETEKKALKKVEKEIFIFLNRKNYIQKPVNTKINQILSSPIFIERGFLDNKPTMIEKTKFTGNEELFADWFQFYKKSKEYQDFYNTEKYPLKSDLSKSELKSINKKINQQKKNDVFALHMAKKIFNDLFPINNNLDITLSDLFGQNIWDKTLTLELFEGKLKIKDVKIKDIGKYRKYENDSRVKLLTEYFPDREWVGHLPNDKNTPAYNSIERQLEEYERIRSEELFKEVHKLEKEIYDQVEDKNCLLESNNPNFRNYIIKGFLCEIKNYIKDTDTENYAKELKEDNDQNKVENYTYVLINIRNKFSHNQLPDLETFNYCQKIKKINNDQFIAKYYLDIFRTITEILKGNL